MSDLIKMKMQVLDDLQEFLDSKRLARAFPKKEKERSPDEVEHEATEMPEEDMEEDEDKDVVRLRKLLAKGC